MLDRQGEDGNGRGVRDRCERGAGQVGDGRGEERMTPADFADFNCYAADAEVKE